MNWEEEIMFGINQMKKHQKTKRLQEIEQNKSEIKTNILIITILFIIALITLCFFNTMITKSNTKTTEDIVKIARCVDFGECENVNAEYKGGESSEKED